MKAITIRPPWSWWIASKHPAAKRIENRTWRPRKGLGPDGSIILAIHSGLRMDRKAETPFEWSGQPQDGPTGAIVATAVATFRRDSQSAWALPGCWHWELGGVFVLPAPIPCRGAQGLWDVPVDVLDAIIKQAQWAA